MSEQPQRVNPALRVLIAEDEWLVAFTLRRQLEERGCEVVGIAATGDEALELCRTGQPEVVLMDIRMPGTDGLEATRRIMQQCPTCVVMLTASGQHDQVVMAQEAGAMAYIVKPVSGDQVVPAVEVARQRYKEFMALRSEVADLQAAFETRKLVERAKGILIERAHLSEPEAFRKLQKFAMDHRLSLKAVAERILAVAQESDEFFHG